jgi:RHS repeat-associated protein
MRLCKGHYLGFEVSTGYERDPESGLDYMGARYRNVEANITLSTDRFWFKTPHLSPYNFAANNPIRYIDVNGDSINVTTKSGQSLFVLNDGQNTMTTLTAKQIYDKGIQWFCPDAENYMPIISMADNIATNDALKHFSSEDVMEFAEIYRPMWKYGSNFDGDWKVSNAGADGYLMSTIDGFPFWSDAVGQIPFTINSFRNNMRKTGGDINVSISNTIEAGYKYGNGSIINPKMDRSNRYDNVIIRKTLEWASKHYEMGRNIFGNSVIDRDKYYSPGSSLFLYLRK